MIVKYAFVLYDVEIAYDSSFDYNVNVICIWLCTSKVIWNLDFLEVFFKTWMQTDPHRSMSKQGKHTLIKLVKHDRRRSLYYLTLKRSNERWLSKNG
jgi:hypothetical protein